ncbi:hypothetical protein MHH67_11420 [Bacillus sp. FSL K6-0047]
MKWTKESLRKEFPNMGVWAAIAFKRATADLAEEKLLEYLGFELHVAINQKNFEIAEKINEEYKALIKMVDEIYGREN